MSSSRTKHGTAPASNRNDDHPRMAQERRRNLIPMVNADSTQDGQVLSDRALWTVSSEWRRARAVLTFAWIGVVALYWETTVSMVSTWSHSVTYQYGFLVVPIFFYLVWRVRHRVEALRPRPNPWGLAVLAGVGGVWFVGRLDNVAVLQQLALVAMLIGMVWSLLGTDVTRALLFPLFFLLSGVPVGEDLVPILQDYTAWFVVNALQASSVPVLWEGRLLTIPSGTWEVQESCSGIRYVIASMSFGYLYAGLSYQRWSRRMVFFVLSAVVPVVANGLRAYGIVMLGHLTDNRIAVGVDHVIYGWLFFGVVIVLLILLGEKWRDKPWRSVLPASQLVVARPADPPTSATPLMSVALIGLALLGAARASVEAMERQPPPRASQHFLEWSVTPPWTLTASQESPWRPVFHGATTELHRLYTADTQTVDVYVAYYAQDKPGAELINSENTLVDPEHWTPLSVGRRTVVVEGRPVSVQETLARAHRRNRMIWSWYWIDGVLTASPTVTKLYQLKAKITGGAGGGAAVAISAPYRDSEHEAVRTLTDFLQHWDGLERSLSLARQSE